MWQRVPKNVFDVISVVYIRGGGGNAHERYLHNKHGLSSGESVCVCYDTF